VAGERPSAGGSSDPSVTTRSKSRSTSRQFVPDDTRTRHMINRLSNSVIGELLCLAADEPDRSYHQRRALRRAGRAAVPASRSNAGRVLHAVAKQSQMLLGGKAFHARSRGARNHVAGRGVHKDNSGRVLHEI
jgi:hypothetical protein